MAKFTVGEQALVVESLWRKSVGKIVTIAEIGDGHISLLGLAFDYWVVIPGIHNPNRHDGAFVTPEHWLQKIPPQRQEDPGLTRLKKLLEQDTVKHKEKIT